MLQKSHVVEQVFLKNTKTLLKNFKENSVLNKDLIIILKKQFKRVLFKLFGVISLTIRKTLLSLQYDIITQLFRHEATKIRRLKRKWLIKKLRKVSPYMYNTTFLERIKKLPLVMPKEAFCHKQAVVTNFIFRLHYKHKVGLDKKALKVLVNTQKTSLKIFQKKLKKKKNSQFQTTRVKI